MLGLNLAGEHGQLCLSLPSAELAPAPCRSLSGVGFTRYLLPQMQADRHGHVRPGMTMLAPGSCCHSGIRSN